MFMKNNIAKYKKEVIEVMHKISRDKGLLGDFVKDILTPREFENISVRWQIVKRLAKGEHHQSIAEDLHLGVATDKQILPLLFILIYTSILV